MNWQTADKTIKQLFELGQTDGKRDVYNNPFANPEPKDFAGFMAYHNGHNTGQWEKRTTISN